MATSSNETCGPSWPCWVHLNSCRFPTSQTQPSLRDLSDGNVSPRQDESETWQTFGARIVRKIAKSGKLRHPICAERRISDPDLPQREARLAPRCAAQGRTTRRRITANRAQKKAAHCFRRAASLHRSIRTHFDHVPPTPRPPPGPMGHRPCRPSIRRQYASASFPTDCAAPRSSRSANLRTEALRPK